MLSGLFDRISPRPLGLARIIIGFAGLTRSIVIWQVLDRLNDPAVLRVPYVDWLPDPSPTLAIAIVSLWVVSAILFMIGWKVPLSGSALLLSIVVALALDQQTYSNHLYLMAWLVFLLVLASSGSGLNIHRRDRPIFRWPVLLLMIQLSVVYGFSAITKLNESFLSGRVLAGTVGTGLLPFPETWRVPRVLIVVATCAVIVELFIAVFIWRPRFRPAAFVLGLGLHTAITFLMFGTIQLLVFSLEMLALYPLFLSHDKLTVVWDDQCLSCRDWIHRFKRLDVLKSLDVVGKSEPANPFPADSIERAIHLVHLSEETQGFAAITRILEHLVPTLWVAPVLRLPGIRHLGERWYVWQASRRSCPAASGPLPLRSGTAR